MLGDTWDVGDALFAFFQSKLLDILLQKKVG